MILKAQTIYEQNDFILDLCDVARVVVVGLQTDAVVVTETRLKHH